MNGPPCTLCMWCGCDVDGMFCSRSSEGIVEEREETGICGPSGKHFVRDPYESIGGVSDETAA